MSNITNNSPVVTEEKLTEFYEDIKPFLGCPAYVTQEGDAEYYSTDEKVIGRWVDGKPIYQKTYIASSGTYLISSNSWLTTNITIANVDKMISGEAIDTTASSGHYITYPIYTCADSNKKLQLLQTRNITQEADIFTIRYTKTTDSASTTIEQKPTHYSTDEQVVGTWIDGKPIYQKTFSGKTASSATWNTVGALDSSAIPVNYNSFVLKSKANEYYALCGNTNYGFLLKVDVQHNLIVHAQAADFFNCDVIVTVQYTKTTD